MVSNVRTRPFLSTFRNRWHVFNTDHQAVDENSVATASETTSTKIKFRQTRDHSNSSSKPPEQRDLQSPRLLRRDSGSFLSHWGKQGNDPSKSSQFNLFLDDLRDSPDQRSPAYFGRRPSFAEDGEIKTLKPDTRKVMNGYLRQLAAHLDTKSLVLDKKGSCYFYLDKFLVRLEVPKHGDLVTITAVVHRRSVQTEEPENLLHEVHHKMTLPQSVLLQFNKRKSQVVVSAMQPVSFCYDDFQQDLGEFVSIAEQVKTHIKHVLEEEGSVEL